MWNLVTLWYRRKRIETSERMRWSLSEWTLTMWDLWVCEVYRVTELLLRRWQGRSLCPNQCLRLGMQPLFKLLPKWLDFLKTFLFCRHRHLQASSASCLHLLFIRLPAEIRRCNQPFLFIGPSEAARWFQDLESQWKSCEVEKGQSVKWFVENG